MSSEKERLIQSNDTKETGTTTSIRSFLWKYITLAVSFFSVLLGGMILTYATNEWVQHKEQTELFSDITLQKSNVSACGVTNKSDPVYQNYTIVQQHSAQWLMYFSIAQHVPMFVTSILLNTYSDTYGRKFLLMISCTGLCLKYCAITAVMYTNSSIWYITAAYALDGLMGSLYATLAGCFAYVADIISDKRHRVLGIVVMEMLLMGASIVSGILSGYFIETLKLGFTKTAFISSATAILGLLLMIFIVPESLDKNKRTISKSVLGTVKTMFQFYTSSEYKGRRLGYALLLFAFSTSVLSAGNRTSLEQIYLLGLPFCWGPSQIGTFLSVRHAAQTIVGLILLKLLQTCMSNEAIAVLGPVSNIASYIIEALATTDIMIYMVPVSGMLSFIMIPLIRAMMSVITEPDKQGAVFSSIASIEVLSSIAASFSNEIYAATYSFMHGFVFLVLAGLSVICFFLLFAYYVLQKMKLNNAEDIKVYKKVQV